MNSAHLPAPPVLARLFSTRGCLTLALAGAVSVGILCWMPIASGGVRAGLVGSGALAVAAAIAALRHRPRVLAAFAALVLLLCTGVATTRNRKVDTAALRTQITLELRDHLGVAYTWGGENRRGIDCSGLPRNALRGAAIKQAITADSLSSPSTNGGTIPAPPHWEKAIATTRPSSLRQTASSPPTIQLSSLAILRSLPMECMLSATLATITGSMPARMRGKSSK